MSSSLIPYDLRKVIAHEGHYRIDYEPATRQPAKQSMLELFLKESEKPGWGFRVYTGAILSGGAAISSTKFRKELVSPIPPMTEQIVGGEMEAVGLVSISPPDNPAWIVVKGISDFAEDDRSPDFDRTRQLACRNSAMFVLSALMKAKVA